MGLRAPALSSSQDQCLRDPIQIQLNKPSWLQGPYLLIHLYIVYTGNFL